MQGIFYTGIWIWVVAGQTLLRKWISVTLHILPLLAVISKPCDTYIWSTITSYIQLCWNSGIMPIYQYTGLNKIIFPRVVLFRLEICCTKVLPTGGIAHGDEHLLASWSQLKWHQLESNFFELLSQTNETTIRIFNAIHSLIIGQNYHS